MSMRSYKLKSYVPEESFLLGKDARFCRAAFEDCFVLDVNSVPTVIAACKEGDISGLSMSDTASLLHLFDGNAEPVILSIPRGTLIVYPAWQHLKFGLAFLLRGDIKSVEKAYQNAQRYAFSMIFDADETEEKDAQTSLARKLCTLSFYMEHLFGAKRETNVMAHILMIANLVGCRLHETSLSHTSVTLDELELDRLSAYLCCTFMTMRRYNGRILATDQKVEKSTHGPLNYGLKIQQSVRGRVARPTPFDLPTSEDVATFSTHPDFANYQIKESDGAISLHLPLRQKALLSSIAAYSTQTEITITLFPLN